MKAAILNPEAYVRLNIAAHPGYSGAFARGHAEGAIPNGVRVAKVHSTGGDNLPDDAMGTVLGSVYWDERIGYFVEWDSAPRVAVFVMEGRVRAVT